MDEDALQGIAGIEPLLRELLGAVLRSERRDQGRTLAQVADSAGISMQHLSDVERGRKDPSSELLAAITGALGLSVPQLLLRLADDARLEVASSPGSAVLALSSVAGAHRRGPVRTSTGAGPVLTLASVA